MIIEVHVLLEHVLILYTGGVCCGCWKQASARWHGRMCLMGGVNGDSVHHVVYARHVAFLCGNGCEMSRRWWWSGCMRCDKSGADDAVGYLAEALLWSFSDFDCCFVMERCD